MSELKFAAFYACSMVSLVMFATAPTTTEAGDWRQFRGNAVNSVAIDETLPTELSGRNICVESRTSRARAFGADCRW